MWKFTHTKGLTFNILLLVPKPTGHLVPRLQEFPCLPLIGIEESNAVWLGTLLYDIATLPLTAPVDFLRNCIPYLLWLLCLLYHTNANFPKLARMVAQHSVVGNNASVPLSSPFFYFSLFFSPSLRFLKERLLEHPFCPFGAPWWPFGILQTMIECSYSPCWSLVIINMMVAIPRKVTRGGGN